MRKKLASILTCVLVCLPGCSAQTPAQPPLTFRTSLLQAGACTFSAAITADYGETIAVFSLDCRYSSEEGADVTVTAPDSIAGICAHVADTAAYVSYDDMQLGLGSLADGNLAPLAAPYVLGQCWAGAYIDTTGTQDGLLRTTYRMGYEEKELVVDTWFSADTLIPVRAEISYEGRMALCAEISGFSMQKTEDAVYEDTQTNLGGYLARQSGIQLPLHPGTSAVRHAVSRRDEGGRIRPRRGSGQPGAF